MIKLFKVNRIFYLGAAAGSDEALEVGVASADGRGRRGRAGGSRRRAGPARGPGRVGRRVEVALATRPRSPLAPPTTGRLVTRLEVAARWRALRATVTARGPLCVTLTCPEPDPAVIALRGNPEEPRGAVQGHRCCPGRRIPFSPATTPAPRMPTAQPAAP